MMIKKYMSVLNFWTLWLQITKMGNTSFEDNITNLDKCTKTENILVKIHDWRLSLSTDTVLSLGLC